MGETVLLGDEALALGAVHAGISSSYAYPGTPSTEITEFLIPYSKKHGGRPHVTWCANEKTAYEEALGTSFAGRRALVSMKHVGLNVAADPFVNSAIVSIHGGLVVAVADDPGMHSSQDEQDSRFYADFARIICLEPANQQEAYDMAREAYDLSEQFHIPVMIRITTRLAHSRAVVRTGEQHEENPVRKVPIRSSWILLPGNARKQWRDLITRHADFRKYSETCPHNSLQLNGPRGGLGVITAGIARNYYLENAGEMSDAPSHLHIGAYPIPVEKVRALIAHVGTLMILEDGQPFIERTIRGVVPPAILIRGKESGELPPDGELTPDIVRAALGLPERQGVDLPGLTLANRPPQLCAGCPHAETYDSLKKALAGFAETMVTADIGCYTLGALPPYTAIESCVCMGASVSMAKGAAEAGFHPVVAVIGDSTFLHSGITPLLDAISANARITLIILDNQTVAMTGGQPTILPSDHLKNLVLGLGIDPEHVHVVPALRKDVDRNAEIIRKEIDHPGVSVIIAFRECVETAKKKKRESAEVKK